MRILGLIIVVLGLGVGAVLLAANGQQEPESDQTTEREPIVLPISLYLLVSDDRRRWSIPNAARTNCGKSSPG